MTLAMQAVDLTCLDKAIYENPLGFGIRSSRGPVVNPPSQSNLRLDNLLDRITSIV